METVTVDKNKLQNLLQLLDKPNACPCSFCPHLSMSCIGNKACSSMAYEALIVPKQLELF